MMDLRRNVFEGFLSCVFFSFVLLSDVCCITVNAPAEISAVRGAMVTLSCSFTSSSTVTNRMSVDWTFRPQSGGPAVLFFHFLSEAYPPEEDYFRGRVKWMGNPSRGDASIQLLNASLTDNGTYSCSVRNPPDAHGRPAQIILTVTPKRLSVAFTDVAVLLAFILLPSGLTTLVLLGRILCPCWALSEENPPVVKRSPIEVTGEEYFYNRPEKTMCCCYLKDFDDVPDYILHEKHYEHTIAESQC